jgi:OOP family OmpA-OmpF porin
MGRLIQSNSCARQTAVVVFIAGLCFVLARTPCAAEPVMNEQDISEQSVIDALAPETAVKHAVTRGIMHKQVGSTSDSMLPAGKPAAELLITFASNSSTLTDRARTALDKVAYALPSAQLSAHKFRIEGQADPRGSASANMKLSADRAVAVLDYLARDDGIAPERLSAVGKGSSEPLNTRNPAAAENRRVTIVRLLDERQSRTSQLSTPGSDLASNNGDTWYWRGAQICSSRIHPDIRHAESTPCGTLWNSVCGHHASSAPTDEATDEGG